LVSACVILPPESYTGTGFDDGTFMCGATEASSVGRKRNDVLIERQRVFNALGRCDRGEWEWAAVCFRLVEGGSAGNLAGDLKVANLVRQTVRCHGGWSGGDLEMKVRHDGVAGIADQPQHLPQLDAVAAMHLDTAGLQVGVERVAVAAEVENDEV